MASHRTHGTARGSPAGDERTAVLITALDVESRAVAEQLDQAPGDLSLREVRGTVYETGTFSGRRGRWRVAVAEAGPGNTAAGVELERAAAAFCPDIALFVGIAGGLKDVELGDVVAADAVYDYETVKETRTGILPRIKTQSPSYRLVQYARAVARKAEWPRRVRPVPPPEPWPRAMVRPIAAGSKLVADDRSRTAQLLRAQCSDALAVEMEGYGFLHGAYLNASLEALVVRGISDHLAGKGEANDRLEQPRAARHAAAFAFELLDSLDGPRPDEEGPGHPPV
jgi:nucleoside phosphorylase